MDNSDELPGLCTNFSCDKLHRFQCANNKCIPRYQVCDGRDNCNDGVASDENNQGCSSKLRQCGLGEFRCANRKCVDKSVVCNLEDNCGDHSDEREYFIYFHQLNS